MKKLNYFLLYSVLICMTLTGCSVRPSEKLLYTSDRFEAMAASVPDERVLADTFASDLCVVTGEEESSDPSVNAESAGLFSIADQQVIFQKQVFERMHPASITKVMTALLAVKYGNPDDLVTVGEETVIREAGASLCNIHPGDTLTLEQLLYGLMLPSGNDAGTAIAVHMAGSIEAFSERMNEEARKIGATDTHFVNPHGLTDETHLTTAYDLYLILNEALKYPEFRKIIGTADYVAQYQDGQGNEISQTWHNSNKYLNGERETPEGLQVLGGKTGTTNAAGYCLILACEDEKGQDYVSVVLKAGSRSDLYDNMTNIIRKIVN